MFSHANAMSNSIFILIFYFHGSARNAHWSYAKIPLLDGRGAKIMAVF
jgi:hypothetical protein